MAGKDVTQIKTALARFEAESAKGLREKLQDKHAGATNWLVASLFTINGAGAVQLLTDEGALSLPLGIAAVCFVFGLLFCFAAVVCVQASDRFMIPAMHSWGLFWTGISEGDDYDQAREFELKKRIMAADRIGRFSRAFLTLAALDFILGVSLALAPKLSFL
jgi:succinate-acetate transporter protein